MAKLLILVHVLVILGFALTCTAQTMYTVGDNSGWDISTDLDTWATGKKFVVGDVLLFQYSSSHSVNEVTKPNYEGCNTTNVLQSSSNGNTTFPLSKPGDQYFVCGDKLHCLSGMKLHVHVQQAQGAASPAAAPQAESGASLPQPSSKNNNPSAVIPSGATSAMLGHGGVLHSLALAFLGFMASVLSIV
ncbi:stellacyanin [Cornus florida]|uniref:stellacyanin n=1 Tax=Cornus florida TaxID=4283 RepID=UPI0028967706|nr:stellacyanin [Cornus florida]